MADIQDIYTIIAPRRDTADNWTSVNPTLHTGELGIEFPNTGIGTGLCKFKIGDGSTKWNDLPYAFDADSASGLYGGTAASSNTLQVRTDTTENWSSIDPVLKSGEITYDSTVNMFKIGNGEKKWSEITYTNSQIDLSPLDNKYSEFENQVGIILSTYSSDIADAKKVATDYLKYNTNGLSIGYTDSPKSILITATDIKIKSGTTVYATYGDSITIGQVGKSQIKITDSEINIGRSAGAGATKLILSSKNISFVAGSTSQSTVYSVDIDENKGSVSSYNFRVGVDEYVDHTSDFTGVQTLLTVTPESESASAWSNVSVSIAQVYKSSGTYDDDDTTGSSYNAGDVYAIWNEDISVFVERSTSEIGAPSTSYTKYFYLRYNPDLQIIMIVKNSNAQTTQSSSTTDYYDTNVYNFYAYKVTGICKSYTSTFSSSTVEGKDTSALGFCARAQNYGTNAAGSCQTTMGKYNIIDTNSNYSLIVGNGNNTSSRSNAMCVKWDGYTEFQNGITLGGSWNGANAPNKNIMGYNAKGQWLHAFSFSASNNYTMNSSYYGNAIDAINIYIPTTGSLNNTNVPGVNYSKGVFHAVNFTYQNPSTKGIESAFRIAYNGIYMPHYKQSEFAASTNSASDNYEKGQVVWGKNGKLLRKVSASSRRYKNSITSMNDDTEARENIINAITNLPVCTFKYNKGFYPDPYDYDKLTLGYIAEDVDDSGLGNYGAVLYDGDKVENWEQRVMLPATTLLAQDNRQKIQKLENKIKELEAKISSMSK